MRGSRARRLGPGPAVRWRAFGNDESGSQLVEFAASLSVLLTVIFGIMDMSRALYADHFCSDAAREATRYAMVRGGTWNNAVCTTVATYSCEATAANITTYVKSLMPASLNQNSVTVTTTWPGTTVQGATCPTSEGTDTPGCVVEVQVTYSFDFVLPFLPKNAWLMSSTSEVAIAE